MSHHPVNKETNMLRDKRVGEAISPDHPHSPRIAEILIDKRDDGDRDVRIVRTTDGLWRAEHDDLADGETVVAGTAEGLAAALWGDGRCPYFVAEALFRVGWLTLDRARLGAADLRNWRRADPLGTSVLPDRAGGSSDH
jgi:hypothetical protein